MPWHAAAHTAGLTEGAAEARPLLSLTSRPELYKYGFIYRKQVLCRSLGNQYQAAACSSLAWRSLAAPHHLNKHHHTTVNFDLMCFCLTLRREAAGLAWATTPAVTRPELWPPFGDRCKRARASRTDRGMGSSNSSCMLHIYPHTSAHARHYRQKQAEPLRCCGVRCPCALGMVPLPILLSCTIPGKQPPARTAMCPQARENNRPACMAVHARSNNGAATEIKVPAT